MGNAYSPEGVRVVLNKHDLWSVTRAGRFVAAFPKTHFETERDVRNVLRLMSRAFEEGAASETEKREPIKAIKK